MNAKMKLLAVVGAAAIMSACAGPQDTAFKAKQAAGMSAAQQDGAAVVAGTMKNSEYYARLYERLSQPPVSQADYIGMQASAKMIDVSKDYEAGRITKDQFDSAKRQVMIAVQGAAQQAQAQAAAQDEARRAAAMNYLMQTRPVTTNCSGTKFSASCTTY